MNRFLEELKRRRVVRAALLYMGAAFVVLQVADLFIEAFQLPPVVFATIGIAAIVGLPVTLVLAWAYDIGGPDTGTDGEIVPSGRWFSGRSLLAIAVFIAAGVVIGLAPRHLVDLPEDSGDTVVRRFEILLPEEAPIAFIGSSPLSVPTLAMAVTPDGNRLVYAGRDEEHGTRLYVRDLGEFEVRPLPGSEGAYAPFISPDGQTVGFFANDQLRVVPIDGGDARIVAETPNPRGGAWWGPDRIIFNDRESSAHWWVPLVGGTPTRLPIEQSQAPENGVVGISQEYHALPDGERFVVNTNLGQVAAFEPETGSLKTVMDVPVNVRVTSDALVYAVANEILALDFDPESASVSGEARTLGSGLRRDGAMAQFVATDRTLIYATGAPYGQRRLAFVSRDGEFEDLQIPAARFSPAAFSPDGKQLAITVTTDQLNIWVYDLETLERRKLTGVGNNRSPHWSADGERIYFASDRGGDGQTGRIYRTTPEGVPGDAVRVSDLPTFGLDQLHPGDIATVSSRGGDIGNDLFLLDLVTGEVQPVSSRPGSSEDLAQISPDGRWLALTSDATGRFEIFIQSLDDDIGRRFQVTTEGGEEPLWAPDMSELYYRYGSRLFAMPISFENGRPVTGRSEVVFEDDRWQNVGGFSYWRNPADGRFLIIRSAQPSTSRSLRVIEGWRNAGKDNSQ